MANLICWVGTEIEALVSELCIDTLVDAFLNGGLLDALKGVLDNSLSDDFVGSVVYKDPKRGNAKGPGT